MIHVDDDAFVRAPVGLVYPHLTLLPGPLGQSQVRHAAVALP